MTELPSGTSARGAIRRLSIPSRTLRTDWRYIVYTPPAYESGAELYPVIYLLHGNFGAPDDFIDQGDIAGTADRLIAARQMQPAIIAMPDGGQSWYLNHDSTPMEDAILSEFIPMIETSERVISSRESRRIGGISMGGYGALRYALTRPDLFSAVALMSPAVYADLPHAGSSAWHGKPFCAPQPTGEIAFQPPAWRCEAYPALIEAYLAKRQPLRFYMESGAQDEFGIADEARRLHDFLFARGQDATLAFREGAHDWSTWSAALASALPFLSPAQPAREESPSV